MNATDQRAKVLDEKRHVSSKISDLSRYIGFGLVAVAYAVLTSDAKTVIKLYGDHSTAIVISAAFGALTIILDYLQFLAGYFVVQQALDNKDGAFKYQSSALSYKARSGCFWAKQVSAVLGAVVFGATVLAPLVCA